MSNNNKQKLENAQPLGSDYVVGCNCKTEKTAVMCGDCGLFQIWLCTTCLKTFHDGTSPNNEQPDCECFNDRYDGCPSCGSGDCENCHIYGFFHG